MDDASDPFAPLTAAEISKAAGQIDPSLCERTARPTCPPAEAEPAALAAARLFRRKPDNLWRYATSDDQTAFYAARWNEGKGKKTFRPISWSEGAGWQFEAWPDHRPLFNLPGLVSNQNALVVICEGEKAAEAAAKIFPRHVVVTSSGGSQAAWKTDWRPLARRRILIWPDNDEAGRKYAREVAAILAALGCEISIIDANALASIDRGLRGPDWSAEGWDAADADAEWPDLEALSSAALGLAKPHTATEVAAAEANLTPDEAAIEHRVKELSGLPEIKYALARASAAKEVGIPVGILDKLVKNARRGPVGAADGLVLADVEPWNVAVNPAALLNEIRDGILRYIVCKPEVAVATTLWIAFTWLINWVQVAPLLIITAPEKRCGKSQLLSLVGHLSFRPLPASNISSAAVYRVVEAHSPTLLLDEADTFMKENEELRGIVNSGHTRQSAFVIRTVGDEHEPKRFSTWGAKAIAGIGRLPETTVDRAVVVELKRKLPSEKTDRLRHADRGQFERHSRMLARFAEDNGAAIGAARPDLPEALNDRAQDNWEPLLAIADRAEGRWPAMARSAALRLSGAAQEATSSSTELLSDIRAVFDERGEEKTSTADLLRALIGREESPWATYHAGKPMTARHLAKRLGEYSIKSTNVRFGHDVQKGFYRSQFADAFARYLPQAPSGNGTTPLQNTETTGKAGVSERSGIWSQSATEEDFPLPLQNERCSGTADVAACGGIDNQDATWKSPKNKDCSGVAEFGGEAGDDEPAEPWGELL